MANKKLNKEELDATLKLRLQLHKTVNVVQAALNEEIDKTVLADHFQELIDDSPGDMSARYWLMQFLEPLNRKELKSVVDGFLVQLLNEDQAKKLLSFYYLGFLTIIKMKYNVLRVMV